MRDPNYLFTSSDLRQNLENHERRLHAEIDAIEADEFLNTSPDDLLEHFVEEFTVEVPRLRADEISVSQDEAEIDVSRDHSRYIRDRSRPFHITGTAVTFYVPFDGDRNLFKCAASSRSTMQPSGEVGEGELIMSYTRLDHDANALRQQFDREIENVQKHLAWIEADAKPFNDALPEKIRHKIETRREKLLADRGLVGSLGFKIRVRDDAPRTYAVPPKRRKPPVHRPRPTAAEPFKPEPALPGEDYERILEILSSMVDVIERSPGAFKGMKEEDLRSHFLVQLNGQYEGGATGETFNFEGKTDILVRVEDRTIFIAECKFWRGPRGLLEAIDQLLGYASWRDTKTSILLFNRGKRLSDVLAKIPEAMRAHPNFKHEVETPGETTFRYVFSHRDDPNRELTITVLVFEVPA